jgi:hypothetical protein
MRKFLFALVFSAVLFFIPFQIVSSQTEDEDTASLRGDLRIADVSAYINVKEVKFASRSDENTDCENNTRGGYCSYLLIAEIKETFKGRIESSKMLEFYTGTEAAYPKKNLLGERVVFLIWSEDEKDKTKNLETIENSTRGIDVLEMMRKITNPQSPINEDNEAEPYSMKALKKEFTEADAIIYADVKSFEPDKTEEFASYPFILDAEIKEVFKGNLKTGQNLEYKEDLLYRPIRKEDLGEQIIFLERIEENGKISYKRFRYSIGDIRHSVLEKLRKIAGESSNRNN